MTEALEVKFVGDIARLTPKPGEVYVMTLPAGMALSQFKGAKDAISAHWTRVMPNVPLMVLAPGIELECIAPEGLAP